MIIAIDGPAASGKSTVSKEIAKRLGYEYLDTGAMYRTVTWQAIQNKVDFSNEAALSVLARNVRISFKENCEDGKLKVRTYLDGINVTEEIRLPKVSNYVSLVAKVPGVRKALVETQRKLAVGKDVVVEGRDIGTCVFSDAKVKIFLNASGKERARRRCLELKNKGHEVSISSLEREIISRDTKDSTRKNSPLLKASDAHVIDTTQKSIEEVVEEILKIIEDKKIDE
mgnify:CR=1 FL=1